MRLYSLLLYAKYQGNQIWHSHFMAGFVSVLKEEEKQEKTNKETKSIFVLFHKGSTGAKITFSFLLSIYSQICTLASWAARHTTVCLDLKN